MHDLFAQASFKDRVRVDATLCDYTTLKIGGPARALVSLRNATELKELWEIARTGDLPLLMLGEGSNVVMSDAGWPGIVVQLASDTIAATPNDDGSIIIVVDAGVHWDYLVAHTVGLGLAGLEAMSGIPGLVGAAPIQNIACYGGSFSDMALMIDVFDLAAGECKALAAAECGFTYRQSYFKNQWRGKYVILGVTLQLARKETNIVRYQEIASALHIELNGEASIADIREAVLAARRRKSMIVESADPESRSAGSFFVNPTVPLTRAQEIAAQAKKYLPHPPTIWPMSNGEDAKIPAGWLIEAAGLKGFVLGKAKTSSKHALAIVATPGATAADVIALARHIRRTVHNLFGIMLQAEPEFIGFDKSAEELLS